MWRSDASERVASAGNTEITIKEQGGDFSGKVKSNNGHCIENRTVKLMKKKPGKDQKIVTDTSRTRTESGRPATPARPMESSTPWSKTTGSCDKARSKTIEL